jgi:putative nucleotidyltransferase with HDIG domain
MIETSPTVMPQSEKRSYQTYLLNVFFVALLSLALTSLMVLYIDRLPSNIREGGIASQDIRADQNYEIIDEKATNQARDDAELGALPVYDFDLNLALDRRGLIRDGFAKAREKLVSLEKRTAGQKKISDDDENELKQVFLLSLGVVLSDAEYESIRKMRFSEDLEASLVALSDSIQKRPILYDKSELKLRSGLGIILRQPGDDGEIQEKVINDFGLLLSLEDVRGHFAKKEANVVQKQLNLDFISDDVVKLALKLVPQFIKTNVSLHKEETQLRRDRARGNVQNVIHKLQKGQIIIRNGDRYEPSRIIILEGIRQARLKTNLFLKFAGVFCAVGLTLIIIYFYAWRHIRRFHPTTKDLYFLGLMLISFLAMLRVGSFMASNLHDAVGFSSDITTFYYVIPLAAGAMLVRTILNAEVALVYAILLSFFAGLFLEHNYELTTYYFLSSLFAASIIGSVERRSQVLRCGLLLGVINVLLVLSLSLIGRISSTTTIDLNLILSNCLFAFLGGTFSALTMLAASPILESIFNYTTNIHLLELANMNHPLLREMIVRAPGTYHHSQLVGILSEAGTRAISGNWLLARVASYYHDIGKMKKPNYFIENQKGDNPHDRLLPSMSAMIIEAHVKDGIEMALEHKLPKVIADFIPEHQGTKLIGFFYDKAKKMAIPDDGPIDEKRYRYSGPKPQSRESGVVMLADTIEAAVRSMPEKTPQKIRMMVEKLVNMHFVDAQLDECELTLRDLHMIVDAFVKILIGIYHQRVEYPEMQQKSLVSLVKSFSHDTQDPHHQLPSTPDNVAPLFKEGRS